MNMTIKKILCATAYVVLAVSCQNGVNEVEPVPNCNGTIDINIGGLMGEYTQVDATKADLVNTVRVSWKGGETVYVFDGTKCLGYLKASLDENEDDRYALLSTDKDHTVQAPTGGTEKLTLVYSPLLKADEAPEVIDGKLSISLADQESEKAPFVVYATLDYHNEESITNTVVPFKLATSVIKINCTGLHANTAIMSATLSGINTACRLTLSGTAAPAVSGDTNGTITRTGDTYFSAEKVNSEGEAVFQIAVPVLSSGTRGLALLQSTGKYEDNNFSQAALATATSVNTVCQLVTWKGTVTFDVLGHGSAPAPITGLDYWSKISAPASPLADHFKFCGWYKEADCLNAWDFAADMVTDNITLYAKWESSQPAGTLPGQFTVDSTGRKVYFSRGNMWHDSTKNNDLNQRFIFKIEDDQYYMRPLRDSTWRSNHANHFYWSDTWACAVAQNFKYQYVQTCDCVYFTNATENTPTSDVSFTVHVDGLTQNGVWRILSSSEWEYLLEKRHMTYGRPRYTYADTVIIKGGELLERESNYLYRGLLIYPDDYNSEEVAKNSGLTWDQIDSAGIVFLRATGVRQSDMVTGVRHLEVGTGGNMPYTYYWTSTAHESDETMAYGLKLSRDGIIVEAKKRDVGAYPVRLVRDCN